MFNNQTKNFLNTMFKDAIKYRIILINKQLDLPMKVQKYTATKSVIISKHTGDHYKIYFLKFKIKSIYLSINNLILLMQMQEAKSFADVNLSGWLLGGAFLAVTCYSGYRFFKS
jgi:ribosomal protein S10